MKPKMEIKYGITPGKHSYRTTDMQKREQIFRFYSLFLHQFMSKILTTAWCPGFSKSRFLQFLQIQIKHLSFFQINLFLF